MLLSSHSVVLHIRKDNRDNIGIMDNFTIFMKTYFVTLQLICLTKMVLIKGQNLWFYWEI